MKKKTKQNISQNTKDLILGRIVRDMRGILSAHVCGGEKRFIYRPFGSNKKYEASDPEDALTQHIDPLLPSETPALQTEAEPSKPVSGAPSVQYTLKLVFHFSSFDDISARQSARRIIDDLSTAPDDIKLMRFGSSENVFKR